MQIYFIRHAQSNNNHIWDQTGKSEGRSEDPVLSEKGCLQLNFLSQFISGMNKVQPTGKNRQNSEGFHFTHLYCSLMQRAIQTGLAVSNAAGIPLIGWVDLHEEGGIYLDNPETGEKEGQIGRNREYLEKNYPGLVLPDNMNHNGWWNRPHESDEEFQERIDRVFQDLITRHGDKDDRVALITHGAFYNGFLKKLLGLPQDSLCWFIMNNVAISRIDIQSGVLDIVYLNRVDFLPKDMIT